MPRRAAPPEIRLTLWLRATPARVWAALTNDRQLAAWNTKPHGHVLRKGGNWAFRAGQSTGRILELRRNRRFVHSQKDDKAYPTMRLDYTIEPWGKDAVLRIRHSGFGTNTEIFGMWKGFWPFLGCNLKTLVETGKPLREGAWS